MYKPVNSHVMALCLLWKTMTLNERSPVKISLEPGGKMKRIRYSEEQFIGLLIEAVSGMLLVLLRYLVNERVKVGVEALTAAGLDRRFQSAERSYAGFR